MTITALALTIPLIAFAAAPSSAASSRETESLRGASSARPAPPNLRTRESWV